MIEKCLLASTEISEVEVINADNVANAVSQLGNLKVTRLIVTDPSAVIIFDSADSDRAGNYALFPEILQALQSNNVFTANYHDGVMVSRAAAPIYSYGMLTGCVYIMESDPELGQIISTLQKNILSITLVLEVGVILFSFFFATRFAHRLKRIRNSMWIIRGGDYSHKVRVGGRDELTMLGDEFNILTERLQTSEGKRRQFVSDASHELKTPLASIKLLSDSILQNDMDMDTIREFVSDIGNEADRLNRMSTKLLSLSKIESTEEIECEIVNIVPTAERVIKMIISIAEENNIRIIRDFRKDSPILIQEDDLYQIIFNLAENAIKYNRPGGTITISLEADEENAILTVTDTGVGIPEDAIPHLFERFFRVDKARSRKSGGSGLGLAIVKRMVERNNGTIHVESVAEQGSSFVVTFPIFETEEPEV